VACKVVCISHETGAGGAEIARLVAKELGFLYVDEEIVVNAAARAGVDPATVASQESRQSLVRRILDGMAAGGVDVASLGGPVPDRPDDTNAEIRSFIREAILQTAGRGGAVIGAHAASFAVEQGSSTLRVLVSAAPATRARRLVEQEDVTEADAARAVKRADAARRDYLQRFYDVDRELPTHYDLVVNTDVLEPERAAQIIAHAASLS
jgi:cytidylate kinase